jgi:hypothetical protein
MARTITKEKAQEIYDEALRHFSMAHYKMISFQLMGGYNPGTAGQPIHYCFTPEAKEKYDQCTPIVVVSIIRLFHLWQNSLSHPTLDDEFFRELRKIQQLTVDAQEIIMSAIEDKYRAIADEFNLTKKTHYADKAMLGWKPLFGKRRRGILEIERDRREFEVYARKIVEDLKVIAHEMSLAINILQRLKDTKIDINTQDTGTSIDAGDDQNPHIPQAPAFIHRDRDASSA